MTSSTSKVRKIKTISPIWFIPILAILIGLYFVIHLYTQKGEEIYIYTKSAEGIEAGKTKVKARSVNIGEVIKVDLSEDLTKVILKVRLNNGYDELLRDDTKFWIVKPRIDAQGVSGLNTLLSGSYIELVPGISQNYRSVFDLLDTPQMLTSDYEGTEFSLYGQEKKSVTEGDMVAYRGINVGFIKSAEFDVGSRKMDYKIFINKPYDSLVTTNTKFWISSGFNVLVGAQGMKIETNTLESIIKGGISFDIPQDMPLGSLAEPNSKFKLFTNEEEAKSPSYDDYLEFVLMFNSSFRGLKPGDGVEFLGWRIGTVMTVPYFTSNQGKFDINNIQIPVLIRIERQRFLTEDEMTNEELKDLIGESIKQGLTAKLRADNIFTGSKYIDLVLDEKLKGSNIKTFNNLWIIPTSADEFDNITANLTAIVNKINTIPFEQIGKNFNLLIENSQKTSKEIGNLAKSMDKVLNSNKLEIASSELINTMVKLQKTLDSYSDNSSFYIEIGKTLKEINLLIKNASATTKKISEKPNSIIFDTDNNGEPIPRKPR